MKQDKRKTEVIFLIEKEEDNFPGAVMAFFPKENYFHYNSDTKVCYAHLGQHSACHLDYARECKEADKSAYLPLKQELEGIGYNLKVIHAYW